MTLSSLALNGPIREKKKKKPMKDFFNVLLITFAVSAESDASDSHEEVSMVS